jgi:CNT family concentrative nucleoside transporter
MIPQNLVSLLGIALLLGVAWILSKHRKAINYRVIIGGLAIQSVVALCVFVVPFGTTVFLFVNDLVVQVLASATAGTKFLFGRLALGPGMTNEAGETSLGFFLAFQALPTVVFFAALVGVLYYVGVMPLLVKLFSRMFAALMRISGAESMCAASNIFVGVESTLVIRPYLGDMTRSELCTVLTAGMGTIASSMLAFYVMILRNEFPTIAGHLVSASILAAPGAVMMSKILYPETESPRTLGIRVDPYYEKETNIVEAIMNGATAGTKLVVGIAGLLLAFLGLVALVDLFLGALGTPLSRMVGTDIPLSLTTLLGYVFYPFVLIIGVPPVDAGIVARIIGERTILTEVVAYQDLARALAAQSLSDPRSAVVAVYALCGFAHVASMAIFVGGASALAPHRVKDLSAIGFRALVAATLSSMLTGAWAGVFSAHGSLLFGQ